MRAGVRPPSPRPINGTLEAKQAAIDRRSHRSLIDKRGCASGSCKGLKSEEGTETSFLFVNVSISLFPVELIAFSSSSAVACVNMSLTSLQGVETLLCRLARHGSRVAKVQ